MKIIYKKFFLFFVFCLFFTNELISSEITEKKYCVVVDGYKWSKYFSDIAKKLGYSCIYVQSTKDPLSRFLKSNTYNPNDFEAIYVYTGNFKNLVEKLKCYKSIKAIVVGLESGIELADLLSRYFDIPCNDLSKTHTRVNKFEMAEILRLSGLQTPKYFKSSNCDQLLNWIDNSTVYPVVLKPLASAGTDGVYICNNHQEVKNAFLNIVNSRENLFGRKNSEVLVQSYLEGTEYIVNTVSCNGSHYVTDIWEYKKRLINGRPIYDRELLLPSEGRIQSLLISYVFNVLNALGIKYGAAHSEVMLTKDGPTLVETGARVGGNVIPYLHSEILCHNQAELSMYSYLDPSLFTQLTKNPYKITKNMMHVLISTTSNGKIEEIPLEKEVRKLPSYRELVLSLKKGDYLVSTYDLLSKPGDLWLVHENLEIIENDYRVFNQKIVPKGFLVSSKAK